MDEMSFLFKRIFFSIRNLSGFLESALRSSSELLKYVPSYWLWILRTQKFDHIAKFKWWEASKKCSVDYLFIKERHISRLRLPIIYVHIYKSWPSLSLRYSAWCVHRAWCIWKLDKSIRHNFSCSQNAFFLYHSVVRLALVPWTKMFHQPTIRNYC